MTLWSTTKSNPAVLLKKGIASLAGGTIGENIAYGRLCASDGEIVEAARRARLEDMLAGLPAGLDTVMASAASSFPADRSSVLPLRACA